MICRPISSMLATRWLHGLRRNGGNSPGTQVQHTLSIGTKGTEFRRFLASKCGTVRAITKSARGFAPIALVLTRWYRQHRQSTLKAQLSLSFFAAVQHCNTKEKHRH